MEPTTQAAEQTPVACFYSSFHPGRTTATPGAAAALKRTETPPQVLIARHTNRDWGNVDAEDAQVNDDAMLTGGRLLSAYTLSDNTTVWVITDPEVVSASTEGVVSVDRPSTTILLPREH
jgi:hypothetical protein